MPETGNKSTSPATAQISIQIDLNGYSFLVLDEASHKEAVFEKAAFPCVLENPEDIQEQLAAIFRTHAILSQGASSCRLIWSSRKFTLVPDSLFKEEMAAALLSRVYPIDELDEVHIQAIPQSEAVCIYTVPAPITNEVIKYQKSTEFTSLAIPIYHFLRQQPAHSRALLYYSSSFVHLCLMDGNSLLLLNSYPADGFESALYFLFLALKQWQMNPRTLRLYPSGNIEEEDIELLKRYFPMIYPIDCLKFHKFICGL